VIGITASSAGNSETMMGRIEVFRTNETASVRPLCAVSSGALEQMELAMKKLIFLALLGLTFQYGDRIDGNEVILYATEWCGYCRKTRELFKENNISFVEYDIEKSERSLKEYKRLGGTGVPLIKINGKVIRGYNQKVILASLNSN
jgi:glutaredoxin